MKAPKVIAIAAATAAAWPLGLLAADSDTANSALQEIVVTAQKRAEDVDKVPISISVFDRSKLEQLVAVDISDVAKLSPGVDYTAKGAYNNITIRGIGSNAGYATTGIYIDDVPIQVRYSSILTNGNTTPQIFDLDRVEILRGPQGTLFGAGAEGGAIRFITPQPSLTEYSGYSRGGLGFTDGGGTTYEAGAALGGPIVADEIGFRVSAWHRRDGGYIQCSSPIPGGYHYDNCNWTDSDVVRAALTFAPTQSFRITPSFYAQHIYSHDQTSLEPAGSAVPGDVFTGHDAALGPQYSNVGNGYFVNDNLQQTPSSDRFYLPAVKAVLDVAAVELTSSTSYLYRDFSAAEDFSNLIPAIFGWPWPRTAAGQADTNWLGNNQQVLSQELRVQSAGSPQPLQWTFGIFYTEARQKVTDPERSPELPGDIEAYAGSTIEDYLGGGLFPGDISYSGIERSTDKQVAAYGQATYQVLSHVSLTAGVRIAHESSEYSIYQTGPLNGGTSYLSGKQSQHVTDPKFGVNFQLDDNNLLYVSAAKGDRIGGVNSPLLDIGQCKAALAALGIDGAPNTYHGDSLWSYEVGSKNKLFGGRLQIEASAFHIDWTGVQGQIYVPACAEGFTANLGKARSNGADFQATAVIGDSLTLGLGVSYTDAKTTNTIVVGTSQFATSGETLGGTPWVVVPTAQYSTVLANGYKTYLRFEDVYRGKNSGPYASQNSGSASYDPNFIPNPSTNQLNGHVGISWDGWDVSLNAVNLLNSHPLLNNAQNEAQQIITASTFRPLTLEAVAIFRW